MSAVKIETSDIEMTPKTDTEAVEKLRKISGTDQSIASFAVRQFETQRAMGESVSDAYNKTVMLLLRIG